VLQEERVVAEGVEQRRVAAAARAFCVSMCTFAPVKQVKQLLQEERVVAARVESSVALLPPSPQAPESVLLYYFTSKARTLSTNTDPCHALLRQYVYFCTSKKQANSVLPCLPSSPVLRCTVFVLLRCQYL
jgi:hypothetical protein